jgi:hypothetical protein
MVLRISSNRGPFLLRTDTNVVERNDPVSLLEPGCHVSPHLLVAPVTVRENDAVRPRSTNHNVVPLENIHHTNEGLQALYRLDLTMAGIAGGTVARAHLQRREAPRGVEVEGRRAG